MAIFGAVLPECGWILSSFGGAGEVAGRYGVWTSFGRFCFVQKKIDQGRVEADSKPISGGFAKGVGGF